MIRSYRQFSGQNLGRLAALSDGIFAVAMTLLVLNVAVPRATVPHAEQPAAAQFRDRSADPAAEPFLTLPHSSTNAKARAGALSMPAKW
jgi:hypothetical protein